MKDNLNKEGIGDLIIEDTNVSEILRINQIKVQRNKEAAEKNKYKTRLELLTIVIFVVVVVVGIIKVNEFNSSELDRCMIHHTENFCMKGM